MGRRYLEQRVQVLQDADPRDVGIYYWRGQVLDVLENAIRGAGVGRTAAVPILGNPEWLDTARLRRFQWTGLAADGKKCHTSLLQNS